MQTALLTAPLHSLDQDDQNKVQHDFSGHVTSLAQVSVSHDTDGIVNSTLCPDDQNDFSPVMPLVPVSLSPDANYIIAFPRSR